MAELDDPLSSSYIASSIRSSRRRLKTGSAVVLNTDRLQKYIQNSSVNNDEIDNIAEPDTSNVVKSRNNKKHEVFEHLRKLKLQFNEKSLDSINRSTSNSPQNFNNLPYRSNENNSVLIIQRKWKQFKNYRYDRFTQFGQWSVNLSSKVFSLLLGYRVRNLLKSNEIKMNIKAQKDILQILSEMCSTSYMNNKASITNRIYKADDKWDFIQKIIKEINQEYSTDLLTIHSKLSQSDLKLVKSLVKQLLIERQRLQVLMFRSSLWMLFPSPGYLDLSLVIQNVIISSRGKINSEKSHHVFSPVRKLKHSPSKEEQETPPNLRMAFNNAMKSAASPSTTDLIRNNYTNATSNNTHQYNQSMDNHPNSRPLPLKNVLDMKLGVDQSSIEKVEKIQSFMRTPESQGDSRIASGSKSIISTGSSKKSSIPMSSLTPKSIKSRNSNKGHIQLDILSADKLMSAKKGAVIAADRIPCLRVKLMLPVWTNISNGNKYPNIPQSPENGFKKVQQESRDFSTTTLSPQWDTSFILNLPCTKSIILNILSNHPESITSPPNQELSDQAYRIICKSLLQWWSQGTIVIEVFDGERFNTDIFMGQIQLMLSGFMIAIKKYDDLDIKGSFQLCKIKPTDRVSGSVKLHAYLHVPTKSFINELLNLSINSESNKGSISNSHSDVISKSRLHYQEQIKHRDAETINIKTSQDDQESTPIVYSSKFMKALLSNKTKSHQDHSYVVEDKINQPNLEESENIQFNSKTSVVNRLNNNNNASSKYNNSNNNGTSFVRDTKKAVGIVTTSENIMKVSSIKDQSVDSSMMRRYSMADITKQLDGLSAVQHSTDEIIDNLNLKLKSKGREQSTKAKNDDHNHVNRNNVLNNNFLPNENIIETEIKSSPSYSILHKSSSSHEDFDCPEMNDDDDDDDENINDEYDNNNDDDNNEKSIIYTSSEDLEDKDDSYLQKENEEDVKIRNKDTLQEESIHDMNRKDKIIERNNYFESNYILPNAIINPINSNMYKSKTIYQSSPTSERNIHDESSVYSTNIQDMSYFDDNNSSSGINATTDESDELIVLQQSNDSINQQSNISFQIDKSSSYVIQTINHKLQATHSSSRNNNSKESSPIKRKKHERLPYENNYNTDEEDSNVHRVILELNDLEL